MQSQTVGELTKRLHFLRLESQYVLSVLWSWRWFLEVLLMVLGVDLRCKFLINTIA